MKKIVVLLSLTCLISQSAAMVNWRRAKKAACKHAQQVSRRYDKVPDLPMLIGDPRLEPSQEFTGDFSVTDDVSTKFWAGTMAAMVLLAPAYAITQGRRSSGSDRPLRQSWAIAPFGRMTNATAPLFDDDGISCLDSYSSYRLECVAKSSDLVKLTFVTQNFHKLDDAQKLMPGFKIEHVDFEVPEIQSLDPREVIKYKLESAFNKIQKPCFVMDASLFFDFLNGFPGPLIKWWFEKTVGAEKTCKIAKSFGQYGCRWTTVLGYFDGNRTYFFEETIRGIVSEEPRGTNGYHWDTIFIPEGETRTLAEMTFEEKQSYAVTKKLLNRLKKVVKR